VDQSNKEKKILLVICFVLVAALGLTSGMLIKLVTEPRNENVIYTSKEVKPPRMPRSLSGTRLQPSRDPVMTTNVPLSGAVSS